MTVIVILTSAAIRSLFPLFDDALLATMFYYKNETDKFYGSDRIDVKASVYKVMPFAVHLEDTLR